MPKSKTTPSPSARSTAPTPKKAKPTRATSAVVKESTNHVTWGRDEVREFEDKPGSTPEGMGQGGGAPPFSRPNSNESPKSKAGATTKTGGKGKGATPLGYYAIAYSPHADFAGPCLVTTWAEAAELTQGQRTAIHKKCPYTPVGQEAAEAWLDFG